MSAVMTDTINTAALPSTMPGEMELHFKPSRGLPRELTIIRSRYYLTVVVYPQLKKSHSLDRRRMIAYASIPRDDSGIRLHVDEYGACDLWLASTAFGVTEAELAELAEKLGIRVTRMEPRS